MVATFTILAAPGLWLIDKALSPLPLNIKTSTTVPLASRLSFALAALPVALFIAEWRGFFPGVPKRWTEWIDHLQEHRYWGALPDYGMIFVGFGALLVGRFIGAVRFRDEWRNPVDTGTSNRLGKIAFLAFLALGFVALLYEALWRSVSRT